ncbi:hypothetical protein [Streptomyces griseorubiginosus]|uniref:hypothetical protein n=1 Tax=Streptomyces griseorubiginosus TaxID=67304 RepID=UPI0036A0D825
MSMHFHEFRPDHGREDADTEPVGLRRLHTTAHRLRLRLLTLLAAAVAAPLLLIGMLGDWLAKDLAGGFTSGMLVLAFGALTIVAAALWYDRACHTQCDRQADALRGQTRAYGSGSLGAE